MKREHGSPFLYWFFPGSWKILRRPALLQSARLTPDIGKLPAVSQTSQESLAGVSRFASALNR
jgi:hypothetical protein